MNNWVEPLGLDCIEAYRIGLMGSMFFVGVSLMTLYISRSADIYGRKWPTRLSSMFSVPFQVGLFLSKNINLTTVIFFFSGCCSPGKVNVSFVYVCELVPVKYRTYIGTMVLFADAGIVTLLAVYFRFVSKQWEYFMLVGMGFNVISQIALFFIPESPKWLHSTKKFDEARKQLVYIARFNGVASMPMFKFIEENN